MDLTNFQEALIKIYNETLEIALDENQQKVFLDYIQEEAPSATIAALPKCNHTKVSRKDLSNYTRNNDKAINFPSILRFINFLYEKEGFEALANVISECLRFSSRGISYQSFFSDQEALSFELKIIYDLYECYRETYSSDIKNYLAKFDNIYHKTPDLLEALAFSHPSRYVRLRAASVLFTKEKEKYQRAVSEAVAEIIRLRKEGVYHFKLLFVSACLTNFENESLNAAVKDEWSNHIHTTSYTLSHYMHFKSDFLDEKLFTKGYRPEDNARCKFDFFSKVAGVVGVDDFELCKAVVDYSDDDSDSDLKYAVEFLNDYPSDTLAKIFEYNIAGGADSFRIFDKYRRLFHIQKTDRTILVTALAAAFDSIFMKVYKDFVSNNVFEAGNEPIKAYFDAMLCYIMTGDPSSFQMINTVAGTDALFDPITTSIYDTAEFLGYFSEEELLKDKIQRFIKVNVIASLPYSYGRFLRSAAAEYNWNGEQMTEYILYGEDKIYSKSALLFFDEMLISDKERKKKDWRGHPLNIITEYISEQLLEPCKGYILSHEQETYDFFHDITDYFDCGVLNAYGQLTALDPLPMVHLLTIKEKRLRERTVKALASFPAAAASIEELLKHKRKDVRDYAGKALAAIENMNAFTLPGTAATAATAVSADFDTEKYAKENMPKNADKILATFTDPAQWPPVKYADSEQVVPVDVMKCYTAIYAESKDMQRVFTAEKLRPYFNEEDMNVFAITVFNHWWGIGQEEFQYAGQTFQSNSGGEAKTKGMMVLLAIHGGDEAVARLKDAVKLFDNASRSAMAGDAVKALSLSTSVMALIAIDHISRVVRNKLVKRVASETIDTIAKSLGLTPDEVSDKIVPDLGLNERGESKLDLGTETLTAKIDASLKISLYKEDGKLIKKFPDNKQSAKDETWNYDPELYDHAKVNFSLLKKELKNIVKIQTERLEMALSKAREWSPEAFRELFIQNPIMQVFATSLVFGIYEDKKLAAAFRYSGDGSYSDVNDDEFTLPTTASIRIVHPLDLTSEEIKNWQTQLADYELKQPFLQLVRPVFHAADDHGKWLEAFCGENVTGYFIPKMLKFGWFVGGAGDGGGFYCIYLEDEASGYSACLEFTDDYPYMSNMADCSPSIGHVTFFKTGTVTPSYDFRIDDFNIVPPSHLPAHVYSEIVYRLTQGVDACRVKN